MNMAFHFRAIDGEIIFIAAKCNRKLAVLKVKDHRKLDENMKNLERVLQEFNSQKEDIEATLKAEGDRGKKPRTEVKNWLQNLQRINSKAQSIEQEWIDIVNNNTSRRNTKKIVKKVWEDLMGDKVTKIGVWGMGGIGKTAIMRHINNRPQEETNEFSDVIWVTVSQPLDLVKLQAEIATALKLSPTKDEDKVRRARSDNHMFCWGLRSMGCEEVIVPPLSKEEALNLFLDKVGRNILHVPTLNEEIINSVVEECAGLQLAIFTVVGCMRGVDEIHEWRNALNELRGLVRSFSGINADVLGRLEFSYRRLKNKKVQHCFLYCALYPEDFAISKDELIGLCNKEINVAWDELLFEHTIMEVETGKLQNRVRVERIRPSSSRSVATAYGWTDEISLGSWQQQIAEIRTAHGSRLDGFDLAAASRDFTWQQQIVISAIGSNKSRLVVAACVSQCQCVCCAACDLCVLCSVQLVTAIVLCVQQHKRKRKAGNFSGNIDQRTHSARCSSRPRTALQATLPAARASAGRVRALAAGGGRLFGDIPARRQRSNPVWK
ncbi:putative disease resistance protein [Citrus sinensis]|uniref:Disease resistance protein n=1 Tax=Citrus sinensis TaxID=2711 RepID=A0ACB8JDF4_CITSI|nr:putative disease resistance protein [Citrus sinensis]